MNLDQQISVAHLNAATHRTNIVYRDKMIHPPQLPPDKAWERFNNVADEEMAAAWDRVAERLEKESKHGLFASSPVSI